MGYCRVVIALLGCCLCGGIRAACDTLPILFPSTVNDAVGESYGPVLSADGSTLYFVGLHRADNLGGEDIFCSTLDSVGHWTSATIVRPISTAVYNEAPTSLSSDGSTLFLFSEGKIMLSQRISQGWSTPTALPRSLRVSSWQADAQMSSNGQALLFAAYTSIPGADKPSLNIFISLLDSLGHWSTPTVLPAPINTSGHERSPFLHPDMHTLYFSSDRPGGQGKLDVYVSTRLREDSWMEWSEPQNIGALVNTADDDCWYKVSTDGHKAYFARREDGRQRLYWVALPSDRRPRPVMLLTGKVYDANGPVYTRICWENTVTHQVAGHAITDPTTGAYTLVLPYNSPAYCLYINDEKYYPVSAMVDTRQVDCIADSLCTIRHDFELVSYNDMLYRGVAVPLNSIFFETDKADLLPISYSELSRLARIIQQRGCRVRLSGHTDDRGTAEHNRHLSYQRAEAVCAYLVQCGCSPDVFDVVGYGADRPVIADTTDAARAKNRRVEIQFMR